MQTACGALVKTKLGLRHSAGKKTVELVTDALEVPEQGSRKLKDFRRTVTCDIDLAVNVPAVVLVVTSHHTWTN
jgi:hypothetical protein